MYLFGSVARGTSRLDSDVDVAVLYSKAPPTTFAGLPLMLQAELGCAVDVVALNTAPVDLVHRVLRDGKQLLNRASGARIAFDQSQLFRDEVRISHDSPFRRLDSA